MFLSIMYNIISPSISINNTYLFHYHLFLYHKHLTTMSNYMPNMYVFQKIFALLEAVLLIFLCFSECGVGH